MRAARTTETVLVMPSPPIERVCSSTDIFQNVSGGRVSNLLFVTFAIVLVLCVTVAGSGGRSMNAASPGVTVRVTRSNFS